MVWRLFNSHIPIAKPSSVAVIQDDSGHTAITDDTYIRMGLDEGWLRMVKWYENDNGEIVYVYVIT